ncbi:alpha-xylosidase [Brachybacterium sp. GCM10030267]|uniref:alpha-xylosidase n=1 Tax=Brachybacterium sp. GCM10030267 TaxID=3273381 RepID=UPI0036108B03
MRFTNGYWLDREGFTVQRGRQVHDLQVDAEQSEVRAYAPVRPVHTRGDTLNNPQLTVTYQAVADGVIRVRVQNHRGVRTPEPRFEIAADAQYRGVITEGADGAVSLAAGDLELRIARGDEWKADFVSAGRELTSSLERSIAHVIAPDGKRYMHEQLTLRPGESIYGLGERFGAFVKNGQSVDIWNEDGGTTSEQAYKNVPLYLSSRGYGVFVEDTGGVSFEVGSEMTTRVQFSVEGQSLTYLLIDGPTPKDVLRRYTGLTGRPPLVPEWSYGLWLSTSFTTDYDEATVMSFIDGMEQRGIPLSVFHFDCFWMRGFTWSDFIWDPATFPDPEGMIRRLHERGLKVCVWINPYIAQKSYLFDEGMELGYLVRTTSGDVWQTDLWQAGMALVDFTNPEAVRWYRGKLEALLDMGVDCFKTDFGERIPVRDISWHDGADPEKMHNYYTHLFNRTVFDLLVQRRGEGDAVLFARSATAGGQQYPVHWGGDNDSSLPSMGETLRGGLSLALSGFGYWSHDIGGFEGNPDPLVFKRWLAFGLLSSHSRLHGSSSYRVPWAFDDEAVAVARRFTLLKQQLVPYLQDMARQAHEHGTPLLRPMVLEFPEDRTCHAIDTQYMLGDSLLVAPVFDPQGEVEFYLPEGRWTSVFDGTVETGGRWLRQRHGVMTLPLYVRDGEDLGLDIAAIDG